MIKKILATSVVVGSMFAFVGCGDDNDINFPIAPVAAVETGTSYYIDSAVSGVNYTCGSQEGTTGAEGEFTFEVGESCTFYLGDIELRSLAVDELVDGENVYERDLKIARILQSLDADGDASNGITIDADIIVAFAEAGIDSLPDSAEEMDALLQVIEENGGIVVSEEDAQAHLDLTLEEAIAAGDIPAPVVATLTELIVGKTLYQHCKDSEGDWIATLTFGADGNLVMVDGAETETVAYRIDGNILYTIEEEGEDAHTLGEATSDSITFNETSGETTTFYFTNEAAQASTPTDCGGDEGLVIFSMDYLSGKTLYFVQNNDFGHTEQIGFNVAEMTFNSDGTMIWNEIETLDSGAFNTTYLVGVNAHLFLLADQSEGSGEYSYTSQTADYLQVCDIGNNDCNTYFFFDRQKALDFRDSQNAL